MTIRYQSGEMEFEGAVLDTREENHSYDSDFYAIVWDGEKVTRREYATTRGYTYDAYAKVDATPEVRTAAKAWLASWAFDRNRRLNQAAARQVRPGRRVRVTKGRNVPLGTEGVVESMREQTFGPRYRNGYKRGPDAVQVMLRTDDGTLWRTYAANLEVVNPEQFELSIEKLRSDAARWAEGESYVSAVAALPIF